MARAVFVDTSAWVGFFVRDDQHHREAVEAFEELGGAGCELVTSDYVIAETVTRVRGLSGVDAALKVWEELEGGGSPRVIEVDRSLRLKGRRFFIRYKKLSLSLVDCVSFAVLELLGIEETLTFDSDFRKAGFRVIPARGS